MLSFVICIYYIPTINTADFTSLSNSPRQIDFTTVTNNFFSYANQYVFIPAMRHI